MTTVTLERFAYLDNGVLGKILELDIYTLERPWLNNEPFVSCIPEGFYRVGIDQEGKWTGYPELQNVPGRTEIIVHPANRVDQIEGCIAPGLGWVVAQKEPEVRQSRIAMTKFQEHGVTFIDITSKRSI